MTLTEAFVFKAGNGVSNTDAAAALQFAGLSPNETWNPSGANCSFYKALLGYLERDGVGIRSESEGGYSKTYDTADKADYLSGLADESGCTDLIDKYSQQPKIRNKSYMW